MADTMQARDPSLNERRCIARHDLGFYHGLAIAAVYALPWTKSTGAKEVAHIFGPALQHCVDQHPILGIVIDDPDSEQPKFRRLAGLQLDKHLRFLSPDELTQLNDGDSSKLQEHSLIERALRYVVNTRFPDVRQVPPWRMFIVPLSPSDPTSNERSRFLSIYHYSHSHGDGLSGLAFHHTISQAFCNPPAAKEDPVSATLTIGRKDLPPPPEPLPISWSFFLKTVAKEFLPKFLARLVLSQPHLGTAWAAGPAFCDADKFKVGVKLITIDRGSLQLALERCKEHRIKLTGLLHLIIVRSLATALRDRGINPTSFVSSTPVDIRKVFGLDAMDMGINASAVSYTYALMESSIGPLSDIEIDAARQLTTELARASKTAMDQPIGLLRYAQPLRGWHQGKLGKARDTSYELSNLMAFDPECNGAEKRESSASCSPVTIERVCFSQPADATGMPLSFNAVSLRGGDLSIAICWQIGALGLEKPDANNIEVVERVFVDRLAGLIDKQLARPAARTGDSL